MAVPVHVEDVRTVVPAIVMVVVELVLAALVIPVVMTVLVHAKDICLVGGADVETIAKTTVITVVTVRVVALVAAVVMLHVIAVLLTVVVVVVHVSEEDVLAVVLVPPSAGLKRQ